MAQFRGKFFKIAGFYQCPDRFCIGGGGAYGFGKIGNFKIGFSIDLAAFFLEHLCIDDVERRLVRADIGEKIFDAFRIPVIQNLLSAPHRELRQAEMARERRGGVAGKVSVERGKLQSCRLFRRIHKTGAKKCAAEKGGPAALADKEILDTFFGKYLRCVFPNGSYRKPCFIDTAHCVCENRNPRHAGEQPLPSIGDIPCLCPEKDVAVFHRGKANHTGEHGKPAAGPLRNFTRERGFSFTRKRHTLTSFACSLVGNTNDLWFEQDPGFFENGLPDSLHEPQDILCCGAAPVDNEAGVLFRDFGPALPQTLEPCLFDKSAGIRTGRTFENAAGVWIFERLFFSSGIHIGFGARADLCGIAGEKRKDGADNDVSGFSVNARSVCKFMGAVSACENVVPSQIIAREENIRDFRTVSAGVHVNGAADCSGDSVCEL